MRDLETAILANEKEPNRLKRVSRNIQAAREAVEQTMAEMKADPDYQVREEVQIHFHRHQLPHLLGKSLFFQKCYVLESITVASTGDKRRELLAGQLQHVKDFFLAYKGFIQYYFSEDTRLDKAWFATKSTLDHPVMEEGEELPADLNFGCLLAAYLLAFLEFARLVLQEWNEPAAEQPVNASNAELSYKGKIIDLIEVGMLLWISNSFIVNGKPATEKYIFERLEAAFQIPLGNFAQRITDLRRRREPLEKVKEWTRLAGARLGNLPEDRGRRRLA